MAREDTKPIFDAHRKEMSYPKNLESKDHHTKPNALKTKLENVSMIKDIPQINPAQVDQDLNKLGELEWEPTYKHIVEKDIDKMEGTVSDEFRNQVGVPRPYRKV